MSANPAVQVNTRLTAGRKATRFKTGAVPPYQRRQYPEIIHTFTASPPAGKVPAGNTLHQVSMVWLSKAFRLRVGSTLQKQFALP